MKKNKVITSVLFVSMIVLVPTSHARVLLPSFVTDSMVVQQNDVLTLVGKADGDVEVKASWTEKAYTTTVGDDGRFTLSLPTPTAGGPYKIIIGDSDSQTTLSDIYSGEVWLCSGQSNMEMPVGGWGKVLNYEHEIATANNPNVRFLQIKKATAFSPAEDAEINMGSWRTATPATVENFSSIAYFYAREMSARLGVHVGVIDCTWGGTPAEAWTSFDGIKSVPGFENEVSLLVDNDFDAERMTADYEARVARWLNSLNEVNMDKERGRFHKKWKTMRVPNEWENTELPGLDGVVWLQKEIEIPQEWSGKPLTLRPGMIDDEDITYYNGVQIAKGSGYNVPRQYEVPAKLVKPGKAVVSIRVCDFGGGGGIIGDASGVTIACGDDIRSLAGDWAYYVAADFAKAATRPISVGGSSFPTVLYNAMLHPLNILPIKGVLWYQGCANVGRDTQYSVLFRRLIEDWRRLWNRPELPFHFVQLAAYLAPKDIQPDSQWAALRQAQADALQLTDVAMVSAIDLGDATDIHPKNKQEVAHRLCESTLNHVYGRANILAEAPVVKSWSTTDCTALIKFDAKIFAPMNDDPKGFIVMSPDGVWTRPEVQIKDETEVKLISATPIVAVKYNWADFPDGNLKGESGLPVTPFAIEK